MAARSNIPGADPESCQAPEVAALYRQHHPAVLRVTSALLRQGEDAQDAAQETFLKVLRARSGFRGQGPIRQWLLRIATHAALDRGRRLGREMKTESAGLDAALDPVGDPATLAEAREWERRLLRALLDLPLAFREPLVLRYWDGLALSEIAQRLGMPRSTADKRCREGLALLRQRLGPRAFRSLPLFLVTLPEGAALLEAAATAPLLSAFGAVLMTTKIVAAGVALVLLLGAVGLFLSQSEDDAQDTSLAAARTDRAAALAPGEDQPRDDPSKPATEVPSSITTRAFEPVSPIPAAPEGTFRVAGRVMIGDAPGPAGQLVDVRLHRGWLDATDAAGGEPLVKREVRTADEGWFHCDLEPPDEAMTVQVRAEREGFLPAGAEELVLRGDPAPGHLRLVLRRRDIAIEGKVKDPEGQPIPGAEVTSWKASTTTDAEGRYVLRTSSHVRGDLRVTATAKGFARQFGRVSVPSPGGSATLDFVLRPGASIAGRVVDADQRPVANARVESWYGEPRLATTLPDGSFVVQGLAFENPTSLEVEAEGFARQDVNVGPFKEDVTDVVVVLARGTELRGIVLDPEGAPVEGAQVAVGGEFYYSAALKALTDGEGRFRITGLEPGSTEIHVCRRGFAQLETAVELPGPEASPEEHRLVLRRGQELRGRITYDTGSPVTSAQVAGKSRDGDYLQARASTGPDGSFILADVAGPEVPIEVYGRGFVRLETTVRIGPEPAVITVTRHAVLAGIVKDAQTGDPVPRFRIRIVTPILEGGEQRTYGYSSELGSHGRWFDAPDGRFRIDDEEIPPGGLTGLEAWAEGYAPATERRVITVQDPAPDAVSFELVRAARVEGLVLDELELQPLQGAAVLWRPASEPRARLRSPREEEIRTQVTLEDGSFRFDDVAPGDIILEVRSAGRPLYGSEPIPVPAAGARVFRRLLIPRGAALAGVVEDGAGHPVAGAQIALAWALEESRRTVDHQEATSDGNGKFRFSGLPPGRYRLSRLFRSGNTGIYLYSIEVELGSEDVGDVRLAPVGEASLDVHVTSAEPLPADLTVQTIPLSAEPGPSRRAQTAIVEKGLARFPAIAAGSWRLFVGQVSNHGRPILSTLQTIELAPGEHRKLEIALDP